MLEKTVPVWYVTPPKKHNRIWTDQEGAIALWLRDQGRLAVQEIATMLRATKVQVYNLIRMQRRLVAGTCYKCSKPLSAKDLLIGRRQKRKICRHCRQATSDYKQELRKKALKKGLCGYCHTKPVVKGKKACKECLSATYRRAVFGENICGRCRQAPPKEGFRLCPKCLKINRDKAFAMRHSLIQTKRILRRRLRASKAFMARQLLRQKARGKKTQRHLTKV